LPDPSSASSPAVRPRQPLAATLWPSRSDIGSNVERLIVLVLVGTALLAISAKINLPLPYVPMTLQTLVVLMIGALYGPRLGATTIIAYLAEGASGMPVFAGPVDGLLRLTGPTAGYLFAFIAAAFITGVLSQRGWDRSALWLFAAMMLGHAVILAGGFVWLAYGMKLGASEGWLIGVAPFIAGSIVKSALGATLMLALRGAVNRRG
jgi:biotin transport system substrate-specific component